MSKDEMFLDEILAEVARARAKFPNQDRATSLLALGEEVGELMQAHLQKQSEDRFFKEAVQVACMALRCAID